MAIRKSSQNIFQCERAVTVAIETIFLLSISAVLVGIVMFSFYDLQSTLKEEGGRNQAYNIGAKISRDIYTIHLSGGDYIRKKLTIPERIGGEQYIIELIDGSPPRLKIDYAGGEVYVPLSPSINVNNSRALSYSAYLIYDNGRIELKNE